MDHISHENGKFSHVIRMRKKGLRMRKVCMRTACEILNRADEVHTLLTHIQLRGLTHMQLRGLTHIQLREFVGSTDVI